MYKMIQTEVKAGVLIMSINRPDKLNALNIETFSEINDVMKKVYDDRSIKAVIITGSGQKAFVAGADISEFATFNSDQGKQLSANGHEVLYMIERCSKPVIAAVNGFALGGGCELAMACHIRVASENAKFGQPEVNLGVIPGYGGTQRLIQLIGKGKAIELLMTADMINAEEALKYGLVTHVVKQEELIDYCIKIAEKISLKSPVAIGKVIECVNAYFESGINGIAFEIDAFGQCCGTEDFKEGTSAFLEKRKAEFSGN